MNAARFHEHGGPEVFRYEEAPEPVVPAGGVLVRVRACALNHLDLWQRRGLERVRIPLPHISGADVAGEIIDAGDSGLAPGARVLLQPGLACGRCDRCVAGEDNYCASYDVLGYQSAGGYAERVAVPARNVVPIPDHIEFVSAAAFPLVFLTAWHMLVTRARLRETDTVLVLAAGSGVGHAAVQIAKAAHARVITTTRGSAKIDRARALGADLVIDPDQEDLLTRVRQFTGGRGVDLVVEHVGQATWDKSLRCLARGGRIVTCGATSGFKTELDLRHLFARQLSILGTYMGGKGELLRAASLFFSGAVKPVVDSTFPLSEAGQAHRRMEASDRFGKIVLVVN